MLAIRNLEAGAAIAVLFFLQAAVVRIPTKANADSEGNANGIPGRRRTVIGA